MAATSKITNENHDAAANMNDEVCLGPSEAAPSGMALVPCRISEDPVIVVEKVYKKYPKAPVRATPIEFLVESAEGLNLVVDLNCTPTSWVKDFYIPQSTHHPNIPNIGFTIRSLAEKDGHKPISPLGSNVIDPTAGGPKRATCSTNTSLDIDMVDGNNSEQEIYAYGNNNVTRPDPSEGQIGSTNTVNPGFSLEDMAKFESKQNSMVASARQDENFEGVLARVQHLTHNNDTLEVQRDKESLEIEAIVEGTNCGDACQLKQEKALGTDPIIKIDALGSQPGKHKQNSGVINENSTWSVYASLQSLQKKRDEAHHKLRMVQDQSAQYEMDIQTLIEGESTEKVMSIIERYSGYFDNSPSSKEGLPKLKRRRLADAILDCNKCKELAEICYGNNWILPSYIVFPSEEKEEMYQASVHLAGLDFNITTKGDKKTTPLEARESAAVHILHDLHMKAKETNNTSANRNILLELGN